MITYVISTVSGLGSVEFLQSDNDFIIINDNIKNSQDQIFSILRIDQSVKHTIDILLVGVYDRDDTIEIVYGIYLPEKINVEKFEWKKMKDIQLDERKMRILTDFSASNKQVNVIYK